MTETRRTHLIYFGIAGAILLLYGLTRGLIPLLCEYTTGSSCAERWLTPGAVMVMFGSWVPKIAQDVNIIGEVTPTLAASLMVMFAPKRPEQGKYILWYSLTYVVLYMLYLDLTTFVGGDIGLTNISGALDSDLTPTDVQKSMVALTSSVRLFSVVTAAGLVGLWLQLWRRDAPNGDA